MTIATENEVSGKLFRIAVDRANITPTWWRQARTEIPPNKAGAAIELIDGDVADEAVATAAEAEAFLGWARSLQGWEEERKPLIVEELSFTWRDVRRGHRDLYDETESGRLVLTSFGARVVDALSALDERGLDWYSGWL